jgi:hypothetical protein
VFAIDQDRAPGAVNVIGDGHRILEAHLAGGAVIGFFDHRQDGAFDGAVRVETGDHVAHRISINPGDPGQAVLVVGRNTGGGIVQTVDEGVLAAREIQSGLVKDPPRDLAPPLDIVAHVVAVIGAGIAPHRAGEDVVEPVLDFLGRLL